MVALKPRAYPLDKEGRYLPNLYGLLKMFMEVREARVAQVKIGLLITDGCL
jgi:hypothetical protein